MILKTSLKPSEAALLRKEIEKVVINTGGRRRPEPGPDVFFPEKSSMIRDAVSRLAVKIYDYHNHHGKKVVLFTGCGRKNGSTMVAVSLAAVLSETGKKTLYVDADTRKGSATDSGLSTYLRGRADIDSVIRPTNTPDLDYTPCGERLETPALFLRSGKMAEFISRAKDRYDYVILNCPPVVCYPDASAAFALADGIVLVCSLNLTTKKQLQSARIAVEPYADKYYGVVVNSMSLGQYRKFYS